jgi:FMN phosphatase YigB (HAD superfamily)
MQTNTHKIVLFDIDYTLFDTTLYKSSELTRFQIYDEVVDVLTEVAIVATIGIFSEGELDHQLSKLLNTDIKKHFNDNHVHIFTKKLDALAEVLLKYKNETLYFIDDRLDVLKGIKETDPGIYTIWIKRGIHAETLPNIPGFKPDTEVINLREIISFITAED